MTLPELPRTRLQNQQISEQKLNSPKGLLNWVGAMQAQDCAMIFKNSMGNQVIANP